ncbi:hypothetical protein G6F61_006976 [Rhizopus arrhizus]|nr:hypothetical protein G6F61_006976 [Rhizopus arrhizus]
MNLPQEILKNISRYLTNNQQYRCLTVCYPWYLVFQRALYRKVYIHHKAQLKMFIQSLSKEKGHHVQAIYLSRCNRVGITTKQLEQLEIYCPFLETLDFDQTVWRYINTSTIANMRYLRTLPPCTSLIVTTHLLGLGSLSSLTLQGKWVADLQTRGMLIPMLQQFSQLKGLTLSHLSVISFTLHDMEALYEVLPQLESLEISGSVGLIPSDVVIRGQAYTLQQLTLKANIPPSWIYYSAHKYPQLKRLKIESILPNQHKQARPDLLSLLLKNCPHLEFLQLDSHTCNHYLGQSFFETLLSLSSLKEIKIMTHYQLVSRQMVFDLLSRHASHLVSSLGTEVIETDRDILCIIHPLSSFTQLTELILHCSHPLFKCDVDHILNYCQSLYHLTIRSAQVQCSGSKQRRLCKLQSLYLGSVSFSSDFFRSLSIQCPFLEYLSLYDVEQQQTTKENCVYLDMPANDLKSVILSGVRLLPSQTNIKLLKIFSTTRTRWYYVPQKDKRQKLNTKRSKIAQAYFDGNVALNNKVCWQRDLKFGMISIHCRSIQSWELVSDIHFHEY